MGEFIELIDCVKQDKNNFILIVDRMDPLINKYVRLLYKDNKEDIRQEMIVALWEAVCKIRYYKNDGQVVNFLKNALKNRYFELYKISKKYHDYEIKLEDDCKRLDDLSIGNEFTENILLKKCIVQIINTYKDTPKGIVYLIMVEKLTDSQIAIQLNLSRQYVNRVRRKLAKQLYEELNCL